MRSMLIAGFVLTASWGYAHAAQTKQDVPYFQGKTINMIIDFSAGGPTDTEGRLVARHLPQHLPGSPTIVVRNVAGAGGAIGVNYVGRIAPPDGLTFGYSSGVAFDAALDYPSLKVDLTTMPLIAAGPDVTVVYMRSDYDGGVHKPADLMTKRDFWVAGLSPDSNKDVRMRMEMDLLGLKYHYLTGYPGTADIRLAVQRNEAQVTAESMPSYRASVEPLVEKGEVTPLWYEIGNSDADSDVKGIPATSFFEFYKAQGKNDVHSEVYRAYIVANEIGSDFLRLINMPPGSPPEAIAAMKTAFAALDRDPEFARDAINTIKYVPRFVQGASTDRAFAKALKPDPELVAFLLRYIKEGESGRKQ